MIITSVPKKFRRQLGFKVNSPRLDSGGNIFLQRELETVDPVNYMTLFAGLLGRRYVPLVENVSPLDNVYTYKKFTITGQAKPGAPDRRANDATVVGVTMTPLSQPIEQIPTSYGWGVREIAQAAKHNIPLDQLTIQAAMSVVARAQDTMIAFGLSGSGILGLLNNDNVDFTTPSTKTGAGAGTKWIRTVPVDPKEILADVAKMVSDVRKALKQASFLPGGGAIPAFDSFTLLLDTANYTYIATTPRSDNSDTSILKWIIQNIPWLNSIEEWWQCDLADTAGTGPRAVLYPMDPMCLGAVIPVDFLSLPPQEEGHNIVVPASGSCGGTVIRYEVACRYMEGI